MNRRNFLKTASGVSAGAAAVSAAGTPAAAEGRSAYSAVSSLQEDGETENGDEENGTEENGGEANGTAENGGEDGATETLTVGPDGNNVFDPDSLTIEPGTTVEFVWDSDTHNMVVESGPDEWEGHETIENAGFSYEHTFEEEGTYEYICEPHVAAGMEGTITVTSDAEAGGGGATQTELDIHNIGVPIQKHFLGAATFAAMFVTFAFTFYMLKYGESANTSYPNKKD